jgi:hypothetical protein
MQSACNCIHHGFNHFNFSASILIEVNGLADLATACKNGEYQSKVLFIIMLICDLPLSMLFVL